MTCDEALIAISAALDGESDERERAELDAHLALCAECRAIAGDFGLISAALSIEEIFPAELKGRTERALDAADRAKKKQHMWKRYGSLAAMFTLVLCLGGLFAMQGGGTRKDDAMTYYSFDTAVNGAAKGGVAVANSKAESALVLADSADMARDVEGQYGAPAPSEAISAATSAPAIAPVEPPEKDTVQHEPPDHGMVYSGLKMVYEAMGGVSAYPNLRDKDYHFFTLELTENKQTGAVSELKLEYMGLSENGKYLTYALRQYTQDKEVASMAILNNFAVSKELDEVLAEYGENRSDTDHVKAYRQKISE